MNRLVQVNHAGGGFVAAYVYDALNRRIRKSLGTTFTDCLYSGWQCVEDRDHSDGLIAQYVWGIYLDEILHMQTYAATGSQGLAAGIYYPLADLLYRTTALTDSSGNIVEAYDTDAYGNTLVFTGVGSTHSWWDPNAVQAAIPACPFIFTGQRLDAETGLYYYKRRFYSPAVGRLLSRDPIGYTGGINLYEYVGDSPLARTDPMGTGVVIPPLGPFPPPVIPPYPAPPPPPINLPPLVPIPPSPWGQSFNTMRNGRWYHCVYQYADERIISLNPPRILIIYHYYCCPIGS